jgi:hypothetical protein
VNNVLRLFGATMEQTENDYSICSDCENKIDENDDFCPNCGCLFVDEVNCLNHPENEADGVCIICCEPYCPECSGKVNDKFLCADHAEYEIYQGMARVFGISDESQAQYVEGCLKDAGLHPFIFSRKAGPWHMGSGDYTLFRASGEFDGHIINEIKVMVPCQEVIRAEEILHEMQILE